MAGENDLSGKVGLDTTEFKTGVSELNSQIRAIETGFRASAAVMGDWSSKSDGLKSRTDSLSEKLSLQKQKLSVLTDEWKKAVAENGAGSKAAEVLANKMYSAEKSISSTESDLRKYSEALQKMQSSSSQATSETEKLNSALEKAGKSSESTSSKVKSAFGKVGSGVATSAKAVGTAIAGMGAATVGAAAGAFKLAEKASDLVEAQNVVEQTFKTSGKEIENWTNTTATSAGVGKTAATQWAGFMGAMLKSSGVTESTSASMSKSLVQLTGDMSSFYNIGTSDMWEKIQAGMAGQTKPLKEIGINMSEANLSAEALAEGIKKPWKQMSQAEQTQLRYNYLMKVTKDAQGDFARTSGGMANQTRILQLNIQGLAQNVGAVFLPAVNDAIKSINGMVSALNTAITSGKGFDKLGNVAGQAIAGLMSKLSAALPGVVTVATKIISQLVTSIVQAIPTILPALTNGVVQLINALAQILQQNGPKLVTAGVQAIVTLITGFTQALPQLIQAAITTIVSLANALTAQLPTLIPVAVNAIITIVNGLISNLPQIINAAIDIVVALIQGIMNALPQLIGEVPKIIMGVIQGIVGALPRLINAAPQIIVSIITGIINALPQLVTMTPQIIVAVIGGLIQALPRLLTLGPKILKGVWDGLSRQNWGELGTNILKGIVDGFGNIGNYIWRSIQNAGNTIVNGFKSFFGIHSPSTVMRDQIGTNLGLGVVEGIKSTTKKAAQALQGLTAGNVDIGLNAQISQFKNGFGMVPSSNTTNYNQYGAQQEVNVFQVGAEVVTTAVKSRVSVGVKKDGISVRGALGYG